MPNVIPCQPEMTFEQHERAIGMLTARMLADFSKLGTSRTDRSVRPRKTRPREDRFLTTSSRRNRFVSSRKLGHLLRGMLLAQEFATGQSGIGYTPLN